MKTIITEINEFFRLSGLITEQPVLIKKLLSKLNLEDLLKAGGPKLDDAAKNKIRNSFDDIANIGADELLLIIKKLEPKEVAKLFFDNGLIHSEDLLNKTYKDVIPRIKSGELTFDKVVDGWRKLGRENFFGKISKDDMTDEFLEIADAYVDELSSDFASYIKINNSKIKIPFLNLSAKQRRSLLLREFSSIWNSPNPISALWKFNKELADGRKGWEAFLTWLFTGQTRSISKGWKELLKIFEKEGFSRPILDFLLMKTFSLGTSVMIKYLKLNGLIFLINLVYAYIKEVDTDITTEREADIFAENLYEDIKALWPSLPISYFLPFIYVGAEIKKLISDVFKRRTYSPVFLEGLNQLRQKYSDQIDSIESNVNYTVKLTEFKTKLRAKYPGLSKDIMDEIRYAEQDDLYFYDIYPIKKYGNDYYIINEELKKAKPFSSL